MARSAAISGKHSSVEWNASLYDERFSCVSSYGKDLIPLLDPKPGERVLDLGCGTGHLTAEIADRGVEVIGVDRSVTMIEEARALHPEIQFDVMDARDLRLDGPFDAVFSNAVLHWITKPQSVMQEVARVLRPGGRFVLEMGGQGNINIVCTALARSFLAVGRTDFESRVPWYFPGIGEYSSLLDSNGFRTVFAVLFARPTPLDGGEDAFRTWLDVFAKDILDDLPSAERTAIVTHAEEHASQTLLRDGRWVIDYVRLRVAAERIDRRLQE